MRSRASGVDCEKSSAIIPGVPSRSKSRRRIVLIGLLVVVAALATLAILGLGPSRTVLCSGGSVVDRIMIALSTGLGGGHVDSSTGTYCSVPAPATWVLVLLAWAAAVVVFALLMRARVARRA
jgi:hypothetical protein